MLYKRTEHCSSRFGAKFQKVRQHANNKKAVECESMNCVFREALIFCSQPKAHNFWCNKIDLLVLWRNIDLFGSLNNQQTTTPNNMKLSQVVVLLAAVAVGASSEEAFPPKKKTTRSQQLLQNRGLMTTRKLGKKSSKTEMPTTAMPTYCPKGGCEPPV